MAFVISKQHSATTTDRSQPPPIEAPQADATNASDTWAPEATSSLQTSTWPSHAAENREKKRLESNINRMKDVITELASENIELKKKDMD